MTAVSIIFVLVVFMITLQIIEHDGHPLKKLIKTFWITALFALIFGVNEGEQLGSFFYQGQLNIFMMLFLPIATAILFKSGQEGEQSKTERVQSDNPRVDLEIEEFQEDLDTTVEPSRNPSHTSTNLNPSSPDSDNSGDGEPDYTPIGVVLLIILGFSLIVLIIQGGLK